MKSIIYLSDYGDRPCRPVMVDHDPRFSALEHFKHHDPRYTGSHYHLRYVCTVESRWTIHEKINGRAMHIGKTAWNWGHHNATPPGWGRRRQGPDYQWYSTPERIARSRFRHAKRACRTGRKIPAYHFGYALIDFSFGLRTRDTLFSLTPRELRHLQARLELAATSRAPLPCWRLSDCWNTNSQAA